ncbi:MAG: helix-turn-helix domain-containing protein [Planctomycetota bacterium]
MPYPHTYIKLSPEEKSRISRELEQMALKGKHRKRKRLQAVWLSNSGLTYEEISQRLDVTYQSVKMWILAYKKLGIDEFLARLKK